ncbi:MAG: nitroreductase family protein [Syntrophales bacterium]|nr:nitroreductase family protein [Syntrophales bacterium]
MSIFVVDENKCTHDGACVSECPIRIIELKDENSVPTLLDGADELCVKCGHCVAVCASGALSHTAMTPEQCTPVRREWLLNPEHTEHFLRARRSVRTYKDHPVERDLLAKLIDIARFAPSGHNLQPVNWLVVYDRDKVRSLAGLVVDWMRHLMNEDPLTAKARHMDLIVGLWETGIDAVCRSAPHLIIAHAPEDEGTAPAACTIAMTYLDLAAPSFGLGSCWAGFFNAAAYLWPPLRQALGLPERHISFGTIMVGYPKYAYHRLPIRNEARITWD